MVMVNSRMQGVPITTRATLTMSELVNTGVRTITLT